jgi:hypothetical protein
MNIDEKIKHDLAQQAKDLDALMSKDESLFDYVKLGFTSHFGWLIKLGYVLAILVTLVLFYCGFNFFTATPDNQVFWGICLILSFNAQVAIKLWIFMQTNRIQLLRDIRLIELRRNSVKY